MTTRIVVAVDFTYTSDVVCRTAAEQARLLHAEVVVVNVVHELAALLGIYGQLTVAALQERVERQGGERLRALARHHFASLPHRVRLLVGTPWAEILDCVQEEDAALLVMGTHGASKPEHAFVGSTAKRVLENARCQVLVVPAIKPPAHGRPPAAPT
jgi:nucleotide-binding universal stress UspA family protein